MSQLIFKFPFTTNYYENDFYVSSNNFEAYKLIESYPKWINRWINVYGPKGCGKTHLANILKKKMKLISISAKNYDQKINNMMDGYECLIIEDYDNNIDENLLYSSFNHLKQLNKNILINSRVPIKKFNIKLKDLKSRIESFLDLKIDLPTDDLLRVVISKTFSEKQIQISNKNLEFILKNIERSYEKIFKFIKDVENISLSTGKSININLIKKVLSHE